MPATQLPRAALIFTILFLASAIIIYLLYRAEMSASWSILETEQRELLELGRQRILVNLEPIVSDIMYLAENEAMRLAKDETARQSLGAEYTAFVANKTIYAKVRFLSLEGHEVVRADRQGGKPRLAPENGLQDKKDRYFVSDMRNLGAGQVYVSPFDLNNEHGGIEEPLNPTIRFGMPVFGGDGQKQGYVLLNYVGSRVLNRIRALADDGTGDIWLVNDKGYWLLGPSPEDEWGFMYPERRTRTLAQNYPEAWEVIRRQTGSGQFMADGDFFTFAYVSPSEADISLLPNDKQVVDIVSSESWILVSHVSAQTIAALAGAPRRNHILALGIVAVLQAIIAWIIARSQVTRLSAEKQIRDSETRFRGLLDAAPDAVLAIDGDGRIVFVNAQVEQLFGYPRDQLTGQMVEILVPERFRKRHVGHRQNYAIEPRNRLMGVGLDLHGLRADGTEFPVDISISPVQTNDGILTVCDIRDVTERRESEQKIEELNQRLTHDNEALRNSEARFRGMMDAAPDAIIVSNSRDEIVFLNMQAAQLYGYDHSQLLGRNVLMLNPARYSSGHEAGRAIFFEATIADGNTNQLIRTGLRSDGAEFPIELRTSCVEVGHETLIFSDVRDITEQRETARQLQELNDRLGRDNSELDALNKELEAFSYSVSHDLRAPLRAIDGFSQALIEDYEDVLDDSGRGYLSRVRAAAQRMGHLIDDLLNLARITRTELNAIDVDLSKLVSDVLEQLQQEAPQRASEFIIAPGVKVYGDSRLLRIAMENLLNNAWKFTAGRTPARIEFGRTEYNDAPAYFVRDNGAGFDMAYADKLFGVFQRLHDAGQFPGTGIGLATVQRIIRKHGGNVWAEASLGQGACFTFTLNAEERV